MFERFTEDAIKSIMIAQEETHRLGHNVVGSEAVLLGLMGQGGIAAKALKSQGVDLKNIRIAVEKITGLGPGIAGVEIVFTDQAKKMLERTWPAARRFNRSDINTKHLLIALLEEDDSSVASQALESLGVDLMVLRSVAIAIDDGGPPPIRAEVKQTELVCNSKETWTLSVKALDDREFRFRIPVQAAINLYEELQGAVNALDASNKASFWTPDDEPNSKNDS